MAGTADHRNLPGPRPGVPTQAAKDIGLRAPAVDTEVDVTIRADLTRDGRTACRADLALIDHNRVAEAAVTDPGLGHQLDAPDTIETTRPFSGNSATQADQAGA